MQRQLLTALLVVFVTACGGGGGSDSPAPPTGNNPPPTTPAPPAPAPPVPDPDPDPDPNPFGISDQEAFRFLRQATFGPAKGDVEHVQLLGFEGWIDEQLSMPSSLLLPYMDSLPVTQDLFEEHTNRMDGWFQNVITGDDQLRQRMAFALSEILVVSQSSILVRTPRGLADYYDLLSRQAFGNYRNLIQAVTLHPAMGVYLSMLGNEKPDEALNIRPDENYARELMQLFTLGLIQLNLDGSLILDGSGEPVPTYDQVLIEAFAHVYTGWTYGNSPAFHSPSFNFTQPMEAFPAFHDSGEKLLFNNMTLPAGQSPEQDLSDALDNIFSHQNIAPFVSQRLIQRFVSANPSPEYIARVAQIFTDDGQSARGNLSAVIKAILLDPEARSTVANENSGKLTEPLLRLIAVWRAYNARAANNRYLFALPEQFFTQAPLRSPSVFNFFSPGYAPTGEISNLSLVSPEMQITNETSIVKVSNYLAFTIFTQTSSTPDLSDDAIFIDIESDIGIASNANALVDRVADQLLGGQISAGLRSQILDLVQLHPVNESALRVAEAIHAIATSPEFAVLN